MTSWDRKIHLSFPGWKWAASAVAIIVLVWAILLGTRARQEPTRCAPGLTAMGARCCATGQGLSAGQCVGSAEECPAPLALVKEPLVGCVLPADKVSFEAGTVTLGPTDWDSVDVVERHVVAVRAFSLDRSEVTHHQFQKCVRAGLCKPLGDSALVEPGRPVTSISATDAEQFCAFQAGRLPTPAEWIYAASGSEGRRFPWGPHGLVCRRAAFGLVDGPCAHEGILPDWAGAHPDGQTPEGVFDLAGNVSEWTRDEQGTTSVRGGSFRSRTAGELKVWSTHPPRPGDDVGFRCAYPHD